MGIIDENGRLFGRVNIIDFLVIVFLVGIVPVTYYAFKTFNQYRVPSLESKEYVEIEMPFTFIKLQPETLKLVAVGDKEVNELGQQIGEITWVGEAIPYHYKFTMSNDQRDPYLVKENTDLIELPVKLKLMIEVRDQDYVYYKLQQILYNRPFIFQTAEYKVSAMPIKPFKQRKEQWVQIKVKFAGISPELSSVINNGHIEKDEDDRIIGKLKEIVVNKPSEIQALKLEENKIVVINDPYRTDIVVLLDVLCNNVNGELYFKNYPVKIGSQITFSSALYIISGTITGVNFQSKP